MLIFGSMILVRLVVFRSVFLGEIFRGGSLIGLLLLGLKASLIAWERTLRVRILRPVCIIESRPERLAVLLLKI